MRTRIISCGMAAVTATMLLLHCAITSAGSNLSQEILGRWRGLKTSPGGSAGQVEVLIFAKDGTFVSESPFEYKATYKVVGDKVFLESGRELRFTGESLVGYQSVLFKVHR